MAIDETLKFSWGHIVAFVALIFVSYVSFVGITYLTDGNFQYAGWGVLLINLVLVVFFIIPQILKGTDVKFKKRIKYERFFLFLSPLIFILAMIPFAHFWTVFDKRNQIETVFSESIKTTKGIFDSYELYANERIANFDTLLVEAEIGKIGEQCRAEALKLQILDKNYYELKSSANTWIDQAEGASVWNVFMIGNIDKIENAVNEWIANLNLFTSKIMAFESNETEPFMSSNPSVEAAMCNLNSLRDVYTSRNNPSIKAVVIGTFLYLLLLFPYVVQTRNRKSIYRIFGVEGVPFSLLKKGAVEGRSEGIDIDDEDKSSKNSDYDSFTL